jgi:hypothetical protein
MTPAYAQLGITTGIAQTLNIASAAQLWSTVDVAQNPEYTAVQSTGIVTRSDANSSSQVIYNIDIMAPSARMITATLFINGAATPFRASVQGQGATNPVVLSFDAMTIGNTANTTFQVQLTSDANGTAVTLSNGLLIVRAYPMRA